MVDMKTSMLMWRLFVGQELDLPSVPETIKDGRFVSETATSLRAQRLSRYVHPTHPSDGSSRRFLQQGCERHALEEVFGTRLLGK